MSYPFLNLGETHLENAGNPRNVFTFPVESFLTVNLNGFAAIVGVNIPSQSEVFHFSLEVLKQDFVGIFRLDDFGVVQRTAVVGGRVSPIHKGKDFVFLFELFQIHSWSPYEFA